MEVEFAGRGLERGQRQTDGSTVRGWGRGWGAGYCRNCGVQVGNAQRQEKHLAAELYLPDAGPSSLCPAHTSGLRPRSRTLREANIQPLLTQHHPMLWGWKTQAESELEAKTLVRSNMKWETKRPL